MSSRRGCVADSSNLVHVARWNWRKEVDKEERSFKSIYKVRVKQLPLVKAYLKFGRLHARIKATSPRSERNG